MKNFLPPLLLFLYLHGHAQLPFAETLPATDTGTLTPTLHARVSPGGDYGIAIFQAGPDSMDLYDQSSAFPLIGPAIVEIAQQIVTECDSSYFHQVFVVTDSCSAAGAILFFRAPSCSVITETDTLENIVQILPNPVVRISEIRTRYAKKFLLYDLLGRGTELHLSDGIGLIDRNQFASGVYTYHVLTKEKIITGKVIIL